MSKHDCEACIHKVVCALWEIQNELCDSECAYYQPTLTPPNEPLTLDELREMDGAPVWVVPIGKCKWATRQWCVLAADEALIPGVDHWWWSFEGYGETWFAYRRPLEGEVNT